MKASFADEDALPGTVPDFDDCESVHRRAGSEHLQPGASVLLEILSNPREQPRLLGSVDGGGSLFGSVEHCCRGKAGGPNHLGPKNTGLRSRLRRAALGEKTSLAWQPGVLDELITEPTSAPRTPERQLPLPPPMESESPLLGLGEDLPQAVAAALSSTPEAADSALPPIMGLGPPPLPRDDFGTEGLRCLRRSVDLPELGAVFSAARDLPEELGLQERCLKAVRELLSPRTHSERRHLEPNNVNGAHNQTITISSYAAPGSEVPRGSALQEALGQYGAVAAVLSGLQGHANSASFQLRALHALGLLTQLHLRNQGRFGELGGVQKLLDTLTRYEEDAAVAEACLRCLCCCIYRHPDNQRACALEEGGRSLRRVAELMRRHKDSRGVQREGCRLLFYVASAGPQHSSKGDPLSEHASQVAALPNLRRILARCGTKAKADEAYWLLMSLPLLDDEGVGSSSGPESSPEHSPRREPRRSPLGQDLD